MFLSLVNCKRYMFSNTAATAKIVQYFVNRKAAAAVTTKTTTIKEKTHIFPCFFIIKREKKHIHMDVFMERVGGPLHSEFIYFRQRTFCTYIILNQYSDFPSRIFAEIRVNFKQYTNQMSNVMKNQHQRRSGKEISVQMIQKKRKTQENGHS